MRVKSLVRPVSFNKKLLFTAIFLLVIIAISALLVVTAASIENAAHNTPVQP